MKTALVHDWLVGLGGGEKVLEVIYDLYPSPIYTLVKNEKALQRTFFEDKDIIPSFIQSLPFSKTGYRNYLPLFPLAIEQFDLSQKELIISTSHAVAKGVLTHGHQLHLCYCFTPMRYAWDLYYSYLSNLKGLRKSVAQMVLHSLRKWDAVSASRVDAFATLSHYVARRIKKNYGRDSTVIYPPVNTQDFWISEKKENYYITFSRFVPYKKIDLIVEAFSLMPDKKLIVIGDGPEKVKIKAKATSNIEILGYQPDEVIKEYVSRAKAFVFAAEEDFGIVMVEAQAAGIPVIAFGRGGSLEIVKKGETGLFFAEQTVASLCEALKKFEQSEHLFDPLLIKNHAETFNVGRFKREFQAFTQQHIQAFYENSHLSRR